MGYIEQIAYQGWSDAYRLTNGALELVIPSQVGIRILHCGLVGQANQFYVDASVSGQVGGEAWRLYGGHRLWHAPEAQPRTYSPDNQPIQLVQEGEVIRLTQLPEASTGIQKEVEIVFHPDQAQAKVTHRLINHNLWPVELSVWALSVMAQGGVGIMPLPPYGSHVGNLLPNRALILWPYTRMTDPRWVWGDQFILLRQDNLATTPQKIGMTVDEGWAAYANQGQLFLKTFTPVPSATYPDMGSSVEFYTDATILEVETLGPLTTLAPQASVEHTEQWFVFDGVTMSQNDAEVQAHVLPKVQIALSSLL